MTGIGRGLGKLLRPRRHAGARSAGQSLVEFAITLPVLLVLLGGALDMGRLFYARETIENAAREGAMYGARAPRCATTRSGCSETAEDHARKDAAGLPLDSVAFRCLRSGLAVSVATCDTGDEFEAVVRSTFDFVTPLLEPLFGSTMPLEGKAVSVVRQGAFDPDATPIVLPTPTPGPTPEPTAEPTTAPTAEPTAALCTVPDMVGSLVSDAASTWSNAGFSGSVDITRPPDDDYTVGTQSSTANSDEPCSSDITVGP